METRSRISQRKNVAKEQDPILKLSKNASDNALKKQSILPELCIVFVLFSLSRLLSARFNNINDCDETFNYWEPAHFLLYRDGFQTWEYSPEYAIRSYFYLWLYMAPAYLLKILNVDKLIIFYAIRSLLALVSALIETFFFSTIVATFNRKIARFYCLISLFSPGMFSSTTAFLPSSFGQFMTCLAVGYWFLGHEKTFIFYTALNAIVGWPFTVAISLPMACQVFFRHRFYFFLWSLIFGFFITLLTVSMDSYYYGKLVFASLNIVLYNVFSSNGPELYGREPLTYYVNNLFLNFNIVQILSFTAPIFILINQLQSRKQERIVKAPFYQKQWFTIAALFVWFIIFFSQPHKEERFMYPVYPLIILTAAFTLVNIEEISHNLWPKSSTTHFLVKFITSAFLFIFLLFSISRTVALYKGYSASMRIYDKLYEIPKNPSEKGDTVLCLAKEWHRFPSNFFIPDAFRVEFIPSEFRGQLPNHFDNLSEYPTRIKPIHMNDENREEPSRYVPLSTCHLIIDTDYPTHEPRDLPYSKDKANWSIRGKLPFLDSSRSWSLVRAFYIPILSEKYIKYIDYNLLVNKNVTHFE